MPFVELNVKDAIENEKKKNPEFAKAWDESRTEYKLLEELVKLSKEETLA